MKLSAHATKSHLLAPHIIDVSVKGEWNKLILKYHHEMFPIVIHSSVFFCLFIKWHLMDLFASD